MHGMSGELDMRKMGALKSHLPHTHWTYLVGTLAIAGIFPFAGFFSKDEILYWAFEKHIGFWIIGATAALMTSFYMFRSLFMTFYGESRVSSHAMHHLHESPFLMTVPLMILAGLALVGGFVGIPIIHGGNQIGDFLSPVFAPARHIIEAGHHPHHSVALELILMATSLGIAIVGGLFAYRLYVQKPELSDQMAEEFAGVHRIVYNKYWVDELYDILFVNSIVDFSRFLWRKFDELIIDGAVNGAGWLARVTGNALRYLESGLVKDYAFSILFGSVLIIGYFVLR
jgi:NADH-quinone oxidoreductase subunit L